MKKIFILFSCIFCSFSFINAQNPRLLDDSVFVESHKKNWAYEETYNFINYFDNYIEWKDASVANQLFERLSNTQNRKFTVLHIGDSHIQSDFFSGFVRNNLIDAFGNGGRGMVFPYQAAKTHSAFNFRNKRIGEWEFTRNVLNDNLFEIGLSGATVHTKDTAAGFKLWFPIEDLNSCNKLVKIYYKKSAKSFDLVVKSKNSGEYHIIKGDTLSDKPYTAVLLNNLPDTLEITFTRRDSLQTFFECYGVSFENPEDKGVIYHSVGINGAAFKDVIAQKLFPSQISDLSPDLVIIDLGTNDLLGKVDMNKVEYELKTFISIIKKNSPNSIVLVSTPQDFFKRRKHIPLSKDYASLARKVAFENNCLFYDFYKVSGGFMMMNKWKKKNLAKKDRIHLTGEGYMYKGVLFLNALLNSGMYHAENIGKELVVNKKIKESTLANFIKNQNFITYNEKIFYEKHKIDTVTVIANSKNYRVRKGDNLGSIAAYHGISIDDIKEWNAMRNDKIYEGQILTVKYLKEDSKKIEKDTIVTSSKQVASTKSISTQKEYLKNAYKPKTYIVKQGDTLWDIAQKHNVSVEQIKKINKLKSDKLKPGSVLEI